MRDLGTLGGRQSVAAAITSSGLIVGWSRTKSGSKHACLWAGGEIRDLGTLGGANSEAVAVNDRGQIVGWSEIRAVSSTGLTVGESEYHAVLWTLKR